MKHLIFALAAFLSVPMVAQAASIPLEDLAPGQILAQAYVVRGKDFFDKVKADPKLTIETVTDGKRTDELYLAIMFANPQKDQSGIARVVYNFTMIYPDGTKQPGGKDFQGGNGPLTDAAQKTWIVGNQRIKLPLTAQSPAGTYKFEVVVVDQVSGIKYPSNISVEIK